MTKRRWATRFVAVCLSMAALVAVVAPTTAGTPHFQGRDPGDIVLAMFTSPTDLAYLPSGELLVATKHGEVFLFREEEDSDELALDLSSAVCDNAERGLLGLAADPDFEANHFVYVYYTFRNGASDCGVELKPVNRVSRFVLGADGHIARDSERVVVDRIPSPTGVHNGGGLGFDADGLLYIGVGETGRWGDDAQQLDTLNGKILRVTRDGNIPRSNPFAGDPDAVRCGNPGEAAPALGVCEEIYAWGLRNPFRIAFAPDHHRFIINDVGSDTWEEIDVGRMAADYGWPEREGHCAQDQVTGCAPSEFVEPIYDYQHSEGCDAITAGAFAPTDESLAMIAGAYMFGDFGCGRVWELRMADQAASSASLVFTSANEIVSMTFAPAPEDSLYYLTYGAGDEDAGALHRVNLAELDEPIAPEK